MPAFVLLCLQLLLKALQDTVRASSVWQAAAGLLSAGGGKTVDYVLAKISKALQESRRR